ncbi:MAG: undecaprenyl-diphosphatase [Thermoleophilaceae bacterium]|nr:undecaprenyl-diphosphatase [Thermoleophilaceae bacterium]
MKPPGLPLSHAVGLGIVQGPTEVLPVSSSGHLVLVPAMLDLPYSRLEPELRKSFEVALHAGTAVGLVVAMRGQVAAKAREMGPAGFARLGLTFIPAAAAGLAFERPIERRLGSPRYVAAAQVVAGAALWAADSRGGTRPESSAGWRDAFWIGLGQAAALVPGVSRGGATLTAARLLGFSRPASASLSRQAALPVIAGATALKGVRLSRSGLPPGLAKPFAAGALAALGSTLVSARFTGVLEGRHSLAPVAAYRIGLGLAASARLRRLRPPHGVESIT